MFTTTPSEDARYARAELDTIVSALRFSELVRLIAVGRRLMDEPDSRRDDAPARALET